MYKVGLAIKLEKPVEDRAGRHAGRQTDRQKA
jgi:hypothetical protein